MTCLKEELWVVVDMTVAGIGGDGGRRPSHPSPKGEVGGATVSTGFGPYSFVTNGRSNTWPG